MKIAVEQGFDAAMWRDFEHAIDHYNMVVTGDHSYTPIQVLLRDAQQVVKGGALGGIWGEWLYLKYLWVAEEARGLGYGSQLLAEVETQAVSAHCRGIYLESFDFQAAAFYARRGFETIGQLHDFPPGHTFYYLAKRLG